MTSSLRTVLCDRLGCRYPVVQTAMGFVSSAALTAATTKAGGFGFLAGATIAPGEIERNIQAIKAQTDGPFGINFHMFQSNAQEVIEAVIRHKIAAVSYGRGPDAKTIGRLKDAGVVLMPTVGAVKHAVKAVELGADIITIQGAEGGGHTGSVPTSILLPQVLDAVDVPVVAAGGMFDGRGLAAALAYGAVGIAMGTRFLMTQESPVHAQAKARYLAVRDPVDVKSTTAVDGLSQRFVENEELKRLERLSGLSKLSMALKHSRQYGRDNNLGALEVLRMGLKAVLSDPKNFAATVLAPNLLDGVQRGVVHGDSVHGLLPGGQAAAVIARLDTVDELIQTIMADAQARIQALSALMPQSAQGQTHHAAQAAV